MADAARSRPDRAWKKAAARGGTARKDMQNRMGGSLAEGAVRVNMRREAQKSLSAAVPLWYHAGP